MPKRKDIRGGLTTFFVGKEVLKGGKGEDSGF